MSNMSYCRFENTYSDLEDCYYNWSGAESESEIQYRKKMLELCMRIVDEQAYDYLLVSKTNMRGYLNETSRDC